MEDDVAALILEVPLKQTILNFEMYEVMVEKIASMHEKSSDRLRANK